MRDTLSWRFSRNNSRQKRPGAPESKFVRVSRIISRRILSPRVISSGVLSRNAYTAQRTPRLLARWLDSWLVGGNMRAISRATRNMRRTRNGSFRLCGAVSYYFPTGRKYLIVGLRRLSERRVSPGGIHTDDLVKSAVDNRQRIGVTVFSLFFLYIFFFVETMSMIALRETGHCIDVEGIS